MTEERGLVVIGIGGNVPQRARNVSSAEAQAPPSVGGSCDIVFVIDTTGSMSDKIDGLLATCEKFVDALAVREMDWRIAIVAFGDLTVPGDKIVATGFSNGIEATKLALRKIPRYDGGGNLGESSLDALDRALGLRGYREGAMKVFVLLTDEPALQRNFKADAMTGRLRQSKVLTFVVSIPMDYYKEMAQRTGGDWFPISSDTNFLSILDELVIGVKSTVVAVQTQAGGDVGKYLQIIEDDAKDK